MVRIGNLQLPDFPLLLAPMEDVSDPPFRAVCKDGGADLMYTEFISSEGLIRDAIKSRKKLDIFEEERPIGIQIFGGDEESLGLAAKIVEVTGPDLLDINFGCPVKKVALKGAGAGVLRDIDLLGNDFAMGNPGTCGKDGQGVPVGDGQPTLRVTAMTIGGTAA